ncbi:hypothetical protein LINPERHAP2_LOCUS4365 [Linum perenne]
MSKPLLSKDRL